MSIAFYRDVKQALERIKALESELAALLARVEALEKKRNPKNAD